MPTLFWFALSAQVVFFCGLSVCVGIMPSYVLGENQGGVSNYGSDKRTVVPFALSFAGNAAAGIYKRSDALRKLHFGVGIALLAYESLLGLWLLVFVGSSWFGWLLWTVMLVADCVCVLAVIRIFEKLFVGQVVVSLAFGGVLLAALA